MTAFVRACVSIALLFSTAACGEEPAPDQEGARNPLPIEGAGPIDALTRRYGRLRQRMTARGYGEEVGVGRIFLLEGEGVTLPVDLDTGRCTTMLALAGGSVRSLGMTVYDGEGEEAASGVVDGEGALVHVCPQGDATVPTQPHYLVMNAPEGTGSVVLGAFTSGIGEGRGFHDLFAGVLAPRVPFRAVEEQLARSRSLLRARGLLPIGDAIMESVAEGEGVRREVAMEPGRCYVVVARGGEGMRDVDLLLFDASGAEVARDLEDNAEPSLEICPDEAGTYTLEASAYEGAGAIGALVLAGPLPDDAPDDAEVAAPESVEPPAEGSPASATDPVTSLTGLASALAGRGYSQPVIVVRDGHIAPGEVRTHEVLTGPGCAIVLGAAGRPDTDLDLYLSDAAGRPLDSDTGIQPTARVRACAGDPTVLRVTVKSYGRRGGYAIASIRAPEAITDVQTLRLEEAVSGLRERGYAVADTIDRAFDTGERFERTLSAREGTCTAIAVAGDVGVEDVDVFLRDVSGNLVASSTSPEPYAAAGRCSEIPETLRVEVVMYRGAGVVRITRLEGAP